MRSFFPWNLFWKFFVWFLGLINFIFLITFSIASYVIDFQFQTGNSIAVIGIFFVLSLIGAAAFAYRFSVPIRGIVLRGLRLLSKKQMSSMDEGTEDPDALLDGEQSEYFELEMVMDKIRKKMRKRRVQLAKERQESQALMSSLEDAIVSVGVQQKVQFYNSRFANQFLEKPILDLLIKGDGVPLAQVFREPEILDLFSKTLISGDSNSARIKINSIIEGKPRFYSVKVSPLKSLTASDHDRQIYGAMAVFHDVTELKLTEQIRIEFVENASHELRTPLTSIKGYVDTAKEDLAAGSTAQLGHFLEVISKNANRLVELVNDMLTLSSLEAGLGIKKDEIVPDKLTQDMVERLSPLALEKQIMIRVFSESSNFYADQGKVEQVLENLLSNAIKYIPVGGKIEVKWFEDKSKINLHVSDNGPGIAEEHQLRLFERFYRIDKGRARDVGGTGLGLSIVKHIMQSHGGTVQLKSGLGQGAEFICSFPK